MERRALRMAEIAIGSRADALHIVQDARLSLARSYGHPDPAHWPPPLHRIQDCRRARSGRYCADLRQADDHEAHPLDHLAHDPTPGPDAVAQDEQAQAKLDTAVRALKPPPAACGGHTGAEQQARLRERWQRFRALPPQERQERLDRWPDDRVSPPGWPGTDH